MNYKLIIILTFFPLLLTAQGIFENGNEATRITPTEFSIPASPVFDLMGVTPSQVTRTSEIKDFKVDWSFKSWSLSPNLALQSQPFWEIFYNRKDIAKYQRANGFMRKMASIDVSAGTVKNEEDDRRIGWAVKLNLYKQRDPLLEAEYFSDIELQLKKDKKELEKLLKDANKKLDTTSNILLRPAIRQEIQSLEMELLSLNSRRQSQINDRSLVLIKENWNSAWVDIGFGDIKTYTTNDKGALLGLVQNRSTASGLWINGGFGIGKKVLISALVRGQKYNERVNFVLEDSEFNQIDTSAIADNILGTYGINLRYGGPFFTFFSEFVYERRGLTTPTEALNSVFESPQNLTIIQSTVNWTVVHPYTFNFGGDWRVNRNLIINFGMQFIFDQETKLRTFLPIVGISCMMR